MSLQFLSLASGSSGNCYYLGNEEYGILIDAGKGVRTIKKVLKEYGIPFEKIVALCITHDHADHIKAAGTLGEKYGIPIYTTEAIKTAIYAQCMLELLGKNPVPRYCDDHNDIVTCFDAGTADALIGFCQGIQAASPVDSYAAPEPSPEPGYTDEVVMASGSFTQGSTIELSCDGPLREPYTCYLQGGLNFAASRAGVLLAVQNAYFKD